MALHTHEHRISRSSYQNCCEATDTDTRGEFRLMMLVSENHRFALFACCINSGTVLARKNKATPCVHSGGWAVMNDNPAVDCAPMAQDLNPLFEAQDWRQFPHVMATAALSRDWFLGSSVS